VIKLNQSKLPGYIRFGLDVSSAAVFCLSYRKDKKKKLGLEMHDPTKRTRKPDGKIGLLENE
jgi:hypothetical protein